MIKKIISEIVKMNLFGLNIKNERYATSYLLSNIFKLPFYLKIPIIIYLCLINFFSIILFLKNCYNLNNTQQKKFFYYLEKYFFFYSYLKKYCRTLILFANYS